MSGIKVQKRGNRGYEDVKFDKITDRIAHLCFGLSPDIIPTEIAINTIASLYDGIKTEELDIISAKIAESRKLNHPDYGVLASRILISNLHKTTPGKFSDCMKILAKRTKLCSRYYNTFIAQNADALDNMIINSNDYLFDYFGYKTLEATYLNKIPERVLHDGKPVYITADKKVITDVMFGSSGKPIATVDGKVVPLTVKTVDRLVDRPQYIYMRVAIAICLPPENVGYAAEEAKTLLNNIKCVYKLMSQQYFTHATPTLFNACFRKQQMLSCFLLGTNDSIEEIMKNLTDASLISKRAGGIGIHMSNIRARHCLIKGTNGRSSGLPRQLKMFNEAACTWDQGGRRKGAFAIYLEMHHGDIMSFLRLKLNQGSESERARDLFYAVWVPDLFFKCAREQQRWSFFSEDTAPGLSEVYDGMRVCAKCNYCANKAYAIYMNTDTVDESSGGSEESFGDDPREETEIIDGRAAVPYGDQVLCDHQWIYVDAYTQLYRRYESQGLAVGSANSADVLDAIIDMQRESGTPYVCAKDSVNRMSNQEGIGTIKSSNLCTEIMEWSSAQSYACCTLASINLKKFIINGTIDHTKLHSVVGTIVENLDRIIDRNSYPVQECIGNARDFRPVGIGIQGLADMFAILRVPFLSPEAARIDLEIFETIYHAAVSKSCDLAEKYGSFVGFEHSPAARGELAPDLWMRNQQRINSPLRDTPIFSGRYDFQALRDRARLGMRNSLMCAVMPTVSTSQVLGNTESIEPFAANIYVKTTIGGKFTVVNTHMINHLRELGLWNDKVRLSISNSSGSIQHIDGIPSKVKELYLTVWEMSQKQIMNRAALRQAFVDQSTSLNIHVTNNSSSILRGIFFHGADIGLKTISYYIRTQTGNVMKNNIAEVKKVESIEAVCNGEEGCTMCSS